MFGLKSAANTKASVGTEFPTVPLLPGIQATLGFLEQSRISSGQNVIAWSWAPGLTSLLYLLPQLHHKTYWVLHGSVILFSGSTFLLCSTIHSLVLHYASDGLMGPYICLSWIQWSSIYSHNCALIVALKTRAA